jgi:hypothetical protein
MVINDFEPRRGYSYGYGYAYSYGYSYGYGYKYGYGPYTNSDGYYSDEDEPKPTWKERIKRLF